MNSYWDVIEDMVDLYEPITTGAADTFDLGVWSGVCRGIATSYGKSATEVKHDIMEMWNYVNEM